MKTAKMIAVAVIVIAVIVGVVVGVALTLSPRLLETREVKVGAVLPLTGNRAEGGAFLKSGLDLALAEINSDPARTYKISLIYEDGQYRPDIGVTAIQKLINVDGAKFVIGELSSSVTLAMAPVAEQSKVILITPGSQSEKITAAGDYIFRTQINTAQETPFLAEFIASRTNATVHFLGINMDALPTFVDSFSAAYAAKGGKTGLVEKYEIVDSDFRTQLLKLQQAGAEYIILLSVPKSTGLILKQAKELGFAATFIGTTAVEGEELITAGGDAVEGLIYSYPYDAESEDEAQKSFREKYAAAYGKKPEVLAANTYDTLYLLSNCFERAGADVDDVKDCLYATQNYKGASGTLSFDENGDVVKPFILKTVRNGGFAKL